jgi:hypothetical protein
MLTALLHFRKMAKTIAVNDTDPHPTLVGCTADGAKVNDCTGLSNAITFSPVWTNYSDPSVGPAGAACAAQAPGVNGTFANLCQYSIGLKDAVGTGGADTNNYEICTILENGNGSYPGGSSTAYGSVHVGSDTNGGVIAGCS